MPDGSILISDDWNDAIRRVSYAKKHADPLNHPGVAPFARILLGIDRRAYRPVRLACHGAGATTRYPGSPVNAENTSSNPGPTAKATPAPATTPP